MAYLREIWDKIAPYFANITIAGIVSAVFYTLIKSVFRKTINKIDVDKISEKATEKGIDKIQTMSFTQSIQPICESELKKITEAANEYIKESEKEQNKKIDNIIDVLGKFAAYFDNSIGVSEEKKDALREAVKNAMADTSTKQECEILAFVKKDKAKKEEKVVENIAIER